MKRSLEEARGYPVGESPGWRYDEHGAFLLYRDVVALLAEVGVALARHVATQDDPALLGHLYQAPDDGDVACAAMPGGHRCGYGPLAQVHR